VNGEVIATDTTGAAVNPTVWELDDAGRKEWMTQASAATLSLEYSPGDLARNAAYAVVKDGRPLMAVTSDATGRIRFEDQPGTTAAVHYAVALTNLPPALPTVTVMADDPIATEGGPDSGGITFFRMGAADQPLKVNYTIGGTASNGEDYARLSGQVNFPQGKSTVDIRINPRNDKDAEGEETVVITLSPDTAYELGTPDRATVTITEEDEPPGKGPKVSVTATAPVTFENGIVPGTFTISRAGNPTSLLTVRYALGGTAANGTDYRQLFGAVSIPAGSTDVILAVEPIDDSLIEVEEVVFLALSPDPAYDIVLSPAIVTIMDDDVQVLGGVAVPGPVQLDETRLGWAPHQK
jgi:hypothetical protein